MLAAFAVRQDKADPLAGLAVGERPEPDPPAGWEVIRVRAATLNQHDETVQTFSPTLLVDRRIPAEG